MSTDNELEPIHDAPPAAAETAPAAAPVAARARMPKSTRILAITASGVIAAAAVFGGGVAFGTSLNPAGANTAQQGRFDGTPPTGMTGGPGGAAGTLPTGAPTDAAGGATTTG